MSTTNGKLPRSIAVRPRIGGEAVWVFDADSVAPMPNFGAHPISIPYADPDRWSRIRDVLAAGAISFVLVCLVGLYVSGAFAHGGRKPGPSQTSDPFAVVGAGDGR